MKYAVVCLVLAIGIAKPVLATDIGEYFRPPQAVAATMSPDGHRVAVAEHIDGQLVVTVHDLTDKRRFPVFDARELLSTEQSSVHQLVWLDSDHVAIVVTEDRDAVAELLNTRNHTSTYITRLTIEDKEPGTAVYKVRTSGYIVNALPHIDGAFLYSRPGIRSSLYRIEIDELNLLGKTRSRGTRVDGGQFSSANEIANFSGYVFRWFFDDDDTLRSVFAVTPRGNIQIAATDESETWRVLRQWDDRASYIDSDDRVYPLAMGANTDEYFTLSDTEGQTDGLYIENIATGQRTLIYRHPTADIYQVVIGDGVNTIEAVGIVDRGNIRFEYLNDELGVAADELAEQFPDTNIRLIKHSPDNRLFLISALAFHKPGSFHIWDRSADVLHNLASVMPWLNSTSLAEARSGSVVSHDLAIPYLLTLPVTGEAPFPLVLLPHGGPIGVADMNSFDPTAQLLAASGYAVLQVNYRGSAGYSDSFLEAGKKEWGGKILDDIVAAYLMVRKRPDIDPDRGCAVGASYGGYAALMVGIQYPDLFRCAVSISGVTDVNLFVASPNIVKRKRTWASEYIGDPRSDFGRLAAISPVRLADRSQIPILLVHGVQDNVVDVEHAYRMAHALSFYEKRHELRILPEYGHNISSPAGARALFAEVLEYLRENL